MSDEVSHEMRMTTKRRAPNNLMREDEYSFAHCPCGWAGNWTVDPRVAAADFCTYHNISKRVANPRIVVLCGSTRFKDAFEAAARQETDALRIVLSVGRFGHADGLDMEGAHKYMLDELHKRKIDLADEVLVLDVGGYIGSSTRSEIEYAKRLGKPVRYFSQEMRVIEG